MIFPGTALIAAGLSLARYSQASEALCNPKQKSSLRLRSYFSLSINHGVVKGRLPLKLYSGSDGMHVRTDENPKVFVPCGFCRPGANARGKTRENSNKRRSATFSTLSSSLSLRGCFYACINHILFSCSSLASSFFSISSAAASFLRSSAITFSGAFATKP